MIFIFINKYTYIFIYTIIFIYYATFEGDLVTFSNFNSRGQALASPRKTNRAPKNFNFLGKMSCGGGRLWYYNGQKSYQQG